MKQCYPGLEVDEDAFEEAKRAMDETDSKSVPMAVCKAHKTEYLTPLICTLAFVKMEFWCPYCGRTYGFLDPDPQDQSEELQRRHDIYEFASRKYLRGTGAMQPGARIKLPGMEEPVPFEELPEETRNEYTAFAMKGWETGHKAETLYTADDLVEFVAERTGIPSKDLVCPREKSGMTPCAARDGNTATYEGNRGLPLCVGCETLVVDLVHTEVKHWKQSKTEEGSND